MLCNILFPVNCNHSLKKSQLETKRANASELNEELTIARNVSLCGSLVLLKNEKKGKNCKF